jgi:hypothetical protein
VLTTHALTGPASGWELSFSVRTYRITLDHQLGQRVANESWKMAHSKSLSHEVHRFVAISKSTLMTCTYCNTEESQPFAAFISSPMIIGSFRPLMLDLRCRRRKEVPMRFVPRCGVVCFRGHLRHRNSASSLQPFLYGRQPNRMFI